MTLTLDPQNVKYPYKVIPEQLQMGYNPTYNWFRGPPCKILVYHDAYICPTLRRCLMIQELELE